MNRFPFVFSLILSLTCLALSSRAGQHETPAPNDKAVVEDLAEANLLSFVGGAVVFDAQERLRWENRGNNFDFNNAVHSPTDGNWLEERFRFGVAIEPVSWLQFYAQGQGALELNGRRGTIPGASSAEGNDYFNLRQGYIQFANYDECPFGVKMGRQVLNYGDLRLVGEQDWINYSRTFDAAKVSYHGQGFWVDAFTATPAVIYRGQFDQSDLSTAPKRIADWFSADSISPWIPCLLERGISIRLCSINRAVIPRQRKGCWPPRRRRVRWTRIVIS